MVELKAKSALDGQSAVQIGAVRLQEVEGRKLSAIAPFAGADADLSEAMQRAHGFGFPEPGQVLQKGQARCVWFGHRQALLIDATPDETLAEFALVTDQSDAWCSVSAVGAATEDVLARLCPVDLHLRAFPVGHTARCPLGHINVSLTRVAADEFEITAFRSMAANLWHEVTAAAELVAARAALP
ncbi:sarcosine oxidase subunit gamma [Tropicibacter sp. R15_0]|uniref:sarcosine oxidase subunit gamma n=1 Tax=Tropicibacter sp. R15_0 TaxID=2821101 RepID=UPI001AD981F6|nr:sarcosine oxidase subunit gamma [Tropicibacter sp. R15_0]MBO9467709.1 sarcosine oxidase subunit gamma [Tropicibacter sp. R15_0]